MSFLLRTTPSAARTVFRPAVSFSASSSSSSRGFSRSSAWLLKEDDRHVENQAEHNERHKQDQLQKQKEGKGHWKPELASNSEEAVAADRHSGNESIEELQKKTADHAQKKHE